MFSLHPPFGHTNNSLNDSYNLVQPSFAPNAAVHRSDNPDRLHLI